jgi:folate-dependent phosphoribosylglycinamide formyltransferase PurN
VAILAQVPVPQGHRSIDPVQVDGSAIPARLVEDCQQPLVVTQVIFEASLGDGRAHEPVLGLHAGAALGRDPLAAEPGSLALQDLAHVVDVDELVQRQSVARGAIEAILVPGSTLSCNQFETGPPMKRFTVMAIRCGRVGGGDLPIDIVAVVSNHTDHHEVVEWHGIPFQYVPVTSGSKQEAEDRLRELVSSYGAELVVLARYMQVLSDDLCAELAGRAINIHHSFLPSFKGAKPYHQAHARSVKLVGATAHYVTGDLDEGPIIAQQVIPVDHTHTADALVAVGRDAECAALGQAVRWHCEDRVFVHGHLTVVLR